MLINIKQANILVHLYIFKVNFNTFENTASINFCYYLLIFSCTAEIKLSERLGTASQSGSTAFYNAANLT